MIELKSLIQTVKSLGPVVGRAVSSGQLLEPQCELFEPDPDVLCEYDVEIPVSDGFRLKANIFRSRSAEREGRRLPIIMCAHPYDNHLTPALENTPLGGPPQQYRLIAQEGRPRFSTLTSWESPDPDFWVRAGYAVVNLNLPGYGGSEGPPSVFTPVQARAYHDALEYVAKLPWSTGRVGLNGVSFLAITQFFVASGHGTHGVAPPSLAAISPWEGLSDPFRDVFLPGGVPEEGFPAFWWSTEVKPALTGKPKGFIEVEGSSPPSYSHDHPVFDDWWRAKTPILENIHVPMLVCASFSDHNLHTPGSFRAFERVSSKHKWVYTHRGGKWDHYYSREVQELTKRFMDCFVKGEGDNGFLDVPRVRLEVRSSMDEVHEVRDVDAWPPAGRREQTLMLGADGSLDLAAKNSDRLVMDAQEGELRFAHRFAEGREITGPMALELVLALEADGANGASAPTDVCLFAYVLKRDAQGKLVHFRGSVGSTSSPVTCGYGRAAMRRLDDQHTTSLQPVLAATALEPVEPGEVVKVPIGLAPSATWFEAGSTLEVLIATHEAIEAPPYRKTVTNERGRVVLIVGEGGSGLRVPFV